uniref:Methyltransferase type 11 domain-containing protein n=1 Tax=Neogobius melanostomus TaxID=47308 RepID=A0A8C6U605_9GOBI
MSDIQRTLQDAQAALKSCQFPQSYDQWADNYNTDCCNLGYKGPVCTAEVLMKHFTLSPDQVRVLDLACGTGLVAKELYSLGFRHFVGVDASQSMLEKARLTGLYQDLHQVLLGTEPLPVNSGEFDVVTLTGCLLRQYVPVEVIREVCQVAKPGGLVVMARGNHQTPDNASYTEELQREMQRMEEEGLWKKLEVLQVEHYFGNYNQLDWLHNSGSVYLYQKAV